MSQTKVIVVFGMGAVGKSCVTIQYINGTFVEDYDPTIEDTYNKNISIDGTVYPAEILDTAGQEDFQSMRLPYIRRGHAFVLIYAIDNRASFDEIEKFSNDIKHNKETEHPAMVLIGNKCDLEEQRDVSYEEGQVLADKLGVPFLETSAKEKKNINEVFETALREAIKKDPKPAQEVKEEKKEKKSWCFLI